MPTYITLIRFTDQGARAIQQTADRAVAFKEEAAKGGVTALDVYWTMGAFDGLLVLEGDEQDVAKVLFDLAAKGNVHTQTLRAFDEAEITKLAGGKRAAASRKKK
jgi:uncharacterized protein with GYD domain